MNKYSKMKQKNARTQSHRTTHTVSFLRQTHLERSRSLSYVMNGGSWTVRLSNTAATIFHENEQHKYDRTGILMRKSIRMKLNWFVQPMELSKIVNFIINYFWFAFTVPVNLSSELRTSFAQISFLKKPECVFFLLPNVCIFPFHLLLVKLKSFVFRDLCSDGFFSASFACETYACTLPIKCLETGNNHWARTKTFTWNEMKWKLKYRKRNEMEQKPFYDNSYLWKLLRIILNWARIVFHWNIYH